MNTLLKGLTLTNQFNSFISISNTNVSSESYYGC